MHTRSPEAVVVGAGIMGLGIAWRLARSGLSVEVLEATRVGAGASRAGAGMLAWRSEYRAADQSFRLGRRSAELWADWAEALGGAPRLDYQATGSVMVVPGGDVDGFERELAWQREAGFSFDRLDAEELARRVPGVTARAGFFFADEAAVDPRAAMGALLEAAQAEGVVVREGAPVRGLLLEGGRLRGVRTDAGEVRAATVVNAAGAWSPRIEGVPRPPPVRPVRGQILVVEHRLSHVVRAHGACYLVPRADGRLLVGSTMEEAGYEVATTDAALEKLAAAAAATIGPIGTARRVDAWAGLRPMSADDRPLVGQSAALPGLFYATGHGRNGLLLAPITAELVDAAVRNAASPLPYDDWSPARFDL